MSRWKKTQGTVTSKAKQNVNHPTPGVHSWSSGLFRGLSPLCALCSTHSCLLGTSCSTPLLLLLWVVLGDAASPESRVPCRTGQHFPQWTHIGCPCVCFSAWPFSPEPSAATEAAPSPMASPGLSQCRASAALHDPVMLQNQYHLGDADTLPSTAAIMRHNLSCLWNTVSVPSGNTSRRFHLNDSGLFFITSNFLAQPPASSIPAKQTFALVLLVSC